ncbi:MAG: BamA/TamA family outer membrane protein [Burkholderiaceae bacterium]|nr:BamA/TamA family outer membrane protein [Burkholderiaceae bacterium]
MPFRSLALLLALLLLWPVVSRSQEGTPVAAAGPGLPRPLVKIVETALARYTLAPQADEADEERELRRAERGVREALSTEGYFDPKLRFEPVAQQAGPRYRLIIELGPVTRVGKVELTFSGALTEPRFAERARQLRDAWLLKEGTPFRSAEWEQAKLKLLAATEQRDFADARIVDSNAIVEPATATASLLVELDSGPAYTVGPLQIEGLGRYESSLVERYNPFKPGDPYDRSKMLEFQQALQDTPYFANALATLQTSPEQPELVPLRVVVRESRGKRVSTGVGVETNTGAHVEVSYRQNMLFGKPWVLQSGVRLDQTGGFAYGDILLPPRRNGIQDGVGALVEDSEIEEQRVRRWGLGAARTRTIGPRDGNNTATKLAVNFEHEQRRTPSTDWQSLNVLSTTYGWTRRRVDNIVEPRSGNVIRLEGTVGAGGPSMNQTFVRGYGRVQQYVPVGARDVITVRADLGYVQADSPDIVPSKFLFRTGGTTTVRGYDYESLGVKQGVATVGGRALAVGSAEYVHWLESFGGNWGLAAFVDVGDAADSFSALDFALGTGLGVRYRTPAGPLAVDVAYGARENHVRVHFSIAIAF